MDDSTRFSRISGMAGILAVALVLAGGIIGPQAVAGQRVSGTQDVEAIRAYYAHAELATLSAILLPAAALILLLTAGLHAFATREGSNTLATCGLVFTSAIVPGYILSASLQATLVAVASAGGDVLPLFRLWDVYYNSGLYPLEAAYVLAFTLALVPSRAFPRWFGGLGVVVGLLQLVNATALWIGLPDAATIPGNVGMMAWLLAASILLVLRARSPRATSNA